jgi:hypothetical protein
VDTNTIDELEAMGDLTETLKIHPPAALPTSVLDMTLLANGGRRTDNHRHFGVPWEQGLRVVEETDHGSQAGYNQCIGVARGLWSGACW